MKTIKQEEMEILYSLKSPFIYEGYQTDEEINYDFIQSNEQVLQLLPLM